MSAAIKESKHTPGPWTVSTAPGTVDVRALDGRFVASVDCDQRTALTEIDANAKLIAAAPEMAEALRVVEDAMTPDYGDDDNMPERCRVALYAARAALARAGL